MSYIPLAPIVPTALGSATLTVSTTAVSMPSIPAGATHALVTVDGGDVRFWEDGTTPTSSAGLLIISGSAAELTNLSSVKLIRTGSNDASLNISYRKYT